MYEEWRVCYTDGTATVFWVDEDENPTDRAIEISESIGASTDEIESLHRLQTIEPDEEE